MKILPALALAATAIILSYALVAMAPVIRSMKNSSAPKGVEKHYKQVGQDSFRALPEKGGK